MRGLFTKKTETKHSIASRLKSDLSNFYVPLPGATDKVSDFSFQLHETHCNLNNTSELK